MKKNILTIVSAVCMSISLGITPAFAMDFATIAKNIPTATTATEFVLDKKYSSDIALEIDLSQAIYEENPALFLTYACWEGTRIYTETTSGLNAMVKFNQTFIDRSNSENYSKSYWDYVDSVIAAAGISNQDSDKTKLRKAALFIGQNYVYDYDGCYSAYLNGTPLFNSLTEKQKSFCGLDARLFMGCMLRLGIPCKYIEGNASGRHSWNKVYVDGKWSEVDTTFARKAKNKNNYIFFNSGRTTYGEIG